MFGSPVPRKRLVSTDYFQTSERKTWAASRGRSCFSLKKSRPRVEPAEEMADVKILAVDSPKSKNEGFLDQLVRFFSPEKKRRRRNLKVPESDQREIPRLVGVLGYDETTDSKIYRSPSPTKRKELNNLSPVKERSKVSYKTE